MESLSKKFLLLTFIVVVADFIFGGVYVQVLLSRGLSASLIGTVFFTVGVISSFIEIPSGDWGDRFGQRKLTVIGLLCWGLGLVLFGVSTLIPVTICALLLWTVGQALYSGAPLSLAINSIPEQYTQQRERLVRYANVLKWVGSSVGGLLVLVGAMKLNLSVTVALGGLALLACALWVKLGWPESELFHPGKGTNLLSRVKSSWNHELSALILLFAAASSLLSFLLFAWQPLFVDSLGLPERFLGVALIVLTAFAAIGAASTRFSISRLKRRNIDIWFLLVAATCFLISTKFSAIFVAIGAFGAEFTLSAALTITATRAHGVFTDETRNLMWSVFGWSSSISMAVSDLLLGWVWNAHDLSRGLILSCGVLALSVLTATVYLAFYRRNTLRH